MPDLDMIDSFIGLIFVYLTLSLVVTAFGEALIGLLGERGRILKLSLDRLVGEEVRRQLEVHPRMKALQRSDGRWPSYLPDRLFAELFTDILAGDGKPVEGMPPGAFDRALRAALAQPCRFDVDHVLHLWERSGMDVAAFREALASWFNDTQDRASGWFKRRLGVYLFGLGLAVAVTLNADTIRMYRALTEDPALRAALVEKATEATAIPAAEYLDVCKRIGKAREDAEEAPAGCTALDVAKFQSTELLPLIGWTAADPLLVAFRDWRRAPDPGATQAQSPATPQAKLPATAGQVAPQDAGDAGTALAVTAALSFIGWLLTAGALSLGAPFWFDLLQKLVKVRASLASTASTAGARGAPGAGGAPGAAPPSGGAGGSAPALPSGPPDLTSFQSFRTGTLAYDPVNTLWMLRMAQLAYAEPGAVAAQLGEWGLDGEAGEAPHDTYFFTASAPGAMVLAFRGTEPDRLADWLTDVHCDQVEASWAGRPAVRVHEGFLRALDGAWDGIAPRLAAAAKNATPIWLAGHSLGGGLAVLAAYRLLRAGVNVDGTDVTPVIGGLVTCGQPRAGNRAFADALDASAAGRYLRVVNNRDVVPLLPPPVFPSPAAPHAPLEYAHGGRVAYFNDFGHLVMDPPLWYRSLDKLDIGDAQRIKARLKEAASDHSASGYVKLMALAVGGA